MKINKLSIIRGCFVVILLYFILVALFYYSAGEQLYERESRNQIERILGDYPTKELTSGEYVKQDFLCKMNTIEKFDLWISTYARSNTGSIKVSLVDEANGVVLFDRILDVSKLVDSVQSEFYLTDPVKNVSYHKMAIIIESINGSIGNAVAPWYNSTVNVENQQLYLNGDPIQGVLTFATYGKDNVWTGPRYWYIMGAIAVVLILYCINMVIKYNKNKSSFGLIVIYVFKRYKFLIKQLVSRDFKIKYKRSILGAFWSFLNPLLMMSIQYIVFSTLFKTDVFNYPVYLLSGIVLFNFFSEATNVSIGAIVGNASLITKVYVPKYIYPVSKILSSAINLIISLIPLSIMCLITKVHITKAFFIIPFVLICLLIFCIGIGFILSALMVFFRDVQFIWSVFCMVWMYATPVFYPESILPEKFKMVLQVNPLYYFIKFFRIIILEGISPEPIMYIWCLVCAIIPMIIGCIIFKKLQDKFIFSI